MRIITYIPSLSIIVFVVSLFYDRSREEQSGSFARGLFVRARWHNALELGVVLDAGTDEMGRAVVSVLFHDGFIDRAIRNKHSSIHLVSALELADVLNGRQPEEVMVR